MAKFEHVFEVAASVDKDGKLILRIDKDYDSVITKAHTGVGYGRYEFELGTAEFAEHEKVLRAQRKAIKKMLKEKVFTRKVKINA